MSHPKPKRVKLKTENPKVVETSPALAAPAPAILPKDRLEWVDAWGMATRTMAHVYRPSTPDGVAEVFATARRTGRTVALRGAGCSYGDAFQNREEIVLDLSRMNRILEWNPETGEIRVEPGVRIADLWRYIVGDGWWPPVVSGTMMTTMGGCAGMNIHGKNAWLKGPFGNHVLEFDLLLPSGEVKRVSRESDPELFRGAIGGFGMLGVFLSLKLQMRKVYSGVLQVFPQRVSNFGEMAESFEENAGRMDYMVGWTDCFAGSRRTVGRGEMHFARQLEPGEDPSAAQSLRVVRQELPDLILGILPKSLLWKFGKPMTNDVGMRLINTAKYWAQMRPGASKPYFQSHAAFHFLLDYVPNWKQCYAPGGLIQYQSFVPREHAARVFAEQIRLSHKAGIIPYLGVTKKHIADDYLISHGLDGYSMALDYPVTARNRSRLWALCHQMDELVIQAGGRFYFAKDSTMRAGTAARYLPEENLRLFAELKGKCDPDGILTSELYRRVFGSLQQEYAHGSSHGGQSASKALA